MGYIYKITFLGFRLYATDGFGHNWTSDIGEAYKFTEEAYATWDQEKFHFEPC